ncbi:MAG: hypothetical protein COT13_00805 [Chloroflexi bacterium CG08_land_8_20_14_0_20_45_12]|nr:MAG: hypothetical protein AUK00_04430 [Dehalococcoidia bacterium CG2_30_46_9]PIU23860.1 MAG: hypothetical protein COT13_00805 [Chloroflexi bacterium CG08_land_8_20_14_0_20_45_12]PIX27086.1 MAG: hypothetical protein COZ67_04205 [Chloroflexi bacterium CG_4_8_14_3_um_filter_45_15]
MPSFNTTIIVLPTVVKVNSIIFTLPPKPKKGPIFSGLLYQAKLAVAPYIGLLGDRQAMELKLD